MADWGKIKREYISSGASYRELAAKYGVSHSQMMKVGAREHWAEARKTADRKAEEKVIERIAQHNSRIDDSIFEAAMLLMETYMASLRAAAEEPVPPSALKDYGAALKSIQAVLDKPSDLDIQEQKARIEKLKKDTETEQAADVSIEIKGWDPEWAK